MMGGIRLPATPLSPFLLQVVKIRWLIYLILIAFNITY